MRFLLDTTIISELRKSPARRNKGLEQWFKQVDPEHLFLSVLIVGEIRKGIEIKRSKDPIQALALESWLEALLDAYADRVLPITLDISLRWGRAQCIRSFPVIGSLLAATAEQHSMKLVARKVDDLAGWPNGDLLINPFA